MTAYPVHDIIETKQQRDPAFAAPEYKEVSDMKKQITRILRRTSAAFCAFLFGFGTASPVCTAESPAGGGISYTESTETLLNPGMGYTTTLWYRCYPGKTTPRDPVGSIVLMFIDLGAFSSGENGTKNEDGTYTPGTDYPLDDVFFSALRETFENCRRNGSTIALRFRYDDDGTSNPEPATFDMMKKHIQQIGDSGILSDYQDILMYVESGFVGCYGEQWGGKYCSLEQKAELLDMMLDIVPDPIPVTVRTPNIFAKWAGIEQKDLADWTSEPNSRAARVGMYDDGYMGSDSDLGTYSNRAAETAWLGRQTVRSYFGGEFSGNLEFAQKYDTYLPENAIPEMYQTHLSYINSNIFGLYNDYTFGKEYDVPDVDNSAYYGQTVRKFIRDHLGYRFVLRDVSLPASIEQGDSMPIQFAVENTGFANPIREQKAELILERDGCYIRTPVTLDSRNWYSCQTTKEQFAVQLPGGLSAGKWNVYLKLSVGENTVRQTHLRSVRFANPDIWNAALGANRIGSVTVTETNDVQKLTHTAFGSADGTMYTLNGLQIVDGICSHDGEQGTPLAENDSAALWVHQDANNLYVTAKYDTSAEAEVHNLHLKNQTNGETYWIYFASNGYIYFNHGEPAGVLQKHENGIIEFQIPFGDVMGLAPDVALTEIRYALQDSANEWKVLSDISAKEPYVIENCTTVYNGLRTVSMIQGSTLPLTVTADTEQAAYQWYHNGKAISGAESDSYTIKAADPSAAGTYSVRIRTDAGAEQTVDICEVLQVYSDIPHGGDADGNGTVDSMDIAALRDYLLTKSTALANPQAADLNMDGVLNAADLSMLTALLLSKHSA